jgi:hypothetical protein
MICVRKNGKQTHPFHQVSRPSQVQANSFADAVQTKKDRNYDFHVMIVLERVTLHVQRLKTGPVASPHPNNNKPCEYARCIGTERKYMLK